MADPVDFLALSDEEMAKFNNPEEVSGNAAPAASAPEAEPAAVDDKPVVEAAADAPAAVETPVVQDGTK